MNKNKILNAIILLAFALFNYGCQRTEGANQVNDNSKASLQNSQAINAKAYPVKIMTLKYESVSDYAPAVGIAKPSKASKISFEEGGTILKILKNKGDYVKAGDTLIILDNSILKAQLESARAQYELAEVNFKKNEEIYLKNAASEIQYLQAKYQKEIAKANFDLMKARYEKTYLKAPFDGYIENKFVEVGELANPGVPAFSLIDIKEIKIEAGISENYARQVKKGARVLIDIPTVNLFNINGQVIFVSESVINDNRSFTVEIKLNDRISGIKPNMRANVLIEIEKVKNSILIPEDAAMKTDLGDVAYVYENGKAKLRKISIAFRRNNMISISEGLNEGDSLIVVGQQNLIDGMRVIAIN